MDALLSTILGAVQLLNRITVTGILVTAFALVIYIGLYNRRSPIARDYAIVLMCVIGSYLGDLLAQVSELAPRTDSTELWLRLQWIGIAFIPAALLALSDSLLRATGDSSPLRQLAVKVGYGVGAVTFALILVTALIATPGVSTEGLTHLTPGLLFYPFTLYYFGSVAWATYNVFEARRRALTATSKRRMTYFAIAFAAPALGMFPYLLPVGWPAAFPRLVPWAGILIVNMGVGAAITFMGYAVAYFGASAPDRVIKRRMVKYLIRGPLTAAAVITAFVLSARVERWLDLPGTFIGLVAAATIILMVQWFIDMVQPTLDRLIAGDDAEEVGRLQQFSARLMTTSDLTQYLENILAALCDLLRARTAFVTTCLAEMSNSCAAPINVVIGNFTPDDTHGGLPVPPDAVRSATTLRHGQAVGRVNGDHATDRRAFEVENDFILWGNYWLIPLRSQDHREVLGVMGLAARTAEPDLSDEEREGVAVLVSQAARALEDAAKQRRAFEALERLVPEADDMQRRMASTRNPAAPTVADFERVPVDNHDDFTQLVRDALSQYWGGPKLAESPLINLRVVSEAMKQENGNATKALRRVLSEAIERLKPDGTRSFTAAEWMLYNILELKIMQNMKVRDVARKLVMSESDLYRKQRAAFEEVARIVAEMEREARRREQQAAWSSSDGGALSRDCAKEATVSPNLR
ncbi:MAG: histidine kinase N-terminal 7TM domain-containing protein [Anaerolineae bacterium]|nr:histidine kinase N-terminal 7TM domain-containing protein [Anaerolineae bacterium]